MFLLFWIGWWGLWVCGFVGWWGLWNGNEQKVGWRRCEGEQVAIGDGISWATPCKRKAQPEAQLGAREAKEMSLGGSVVASISQVGTRL